MRLLIYSGDPDISTSAKAGYSSHLLGMIDGFERCGHGVDALIEGDRRVTLVDGAGPETSATFADVTALARRVAPGFLWRMLRDQRQVLAGRRGRSLLRQVCSSTQPDVIYERFAPFHVSGLTVANDLDIPLIVEVNSPPEERRTFGRQSWLEPLFRRRLRKLLREASLVVFVSSALQAHYAQFTRGEMAPSIVVPNAVTGADPSRDARSEAMSVLDGMDDGVLVGFVGSMLAWHRVDVLLEAMRVVREQRPSASLIVVGDGERRLEYENLATEVGLDSGVRFVGAVEHPVLLAIVERFDIAVLVSTDWWCSPVKLFEYAAAGCATIGPDTEPVRETFEDGKEILLVSGEVEEVASAILDLIDDGPRAGALGRAAKERVMQDYTWTAAAAKVLDAFASQSWGNVGD